MSSKPAPKFPDKKLSKNDFLSSLDDLTRINNLVMNFSISQKQNKAEIDLSYETKPILIWALSDSHFTSQFTDHEMFKASLQKIMSAEGAYIFALGDIIDAHADHPALARTETLKPEDQYILFKSFIDYIGDKLLAIVNGNHENSMLEFGFDPAVVYAMYCKAPYFKNVGHVKLSIGKTIYDGVLAHKGKGRSAVNIHGENMKLLNDFNPNADFIMSGDSHKAGIATFYKYDSDYYKEIVSVKTGTFKLFSDDYGRGLGFSDADPATTCILLFPDRRKVIPFSSIDDGLESLRQYRSQAQAKRITVPAK